MNDGFFSTKCYFFYVKLNLIKIPHLQSFAYVFYF